MDAFAKRERSAIEAVAKSASARWEPRAGRPGAYLFVGRNRIAVDVVAIDRRRSRRNSAVTPRLRFDKVATRLVERLRATCAESVSDGDALVWTVTAPIRMPAKTIAAIDGEIRALAARGAPHGVAIESYGNRVLLDLRKAETARTPRTIGFVHNGASEGRVLVEKTRALLEALADADARPASDAEGDRWLVLVGAEPSELDAYRCVYAQLREFGAFANVVLAFDDGRVGRLTP